MIQRGSLVAPMTAGEERRRKAFAQQHQHHHHHHHQFATAARENDAAAADSAAASCPPPIELGEVTELLRAYGVTLPPRDVELYRRALTHRSAAPDGDELRSNERLEWAGDGNLESVFKTHVARRYPHLREDRLSNLKVALVNNVTLGTAVRAMGLDRWYQVAPDKRYAVLNDDKAMGDLFEAFMGAIVADYDDARVALRGLVAAPGAPAALGEWCTYWPPADAPPPATATTSIQRMGRGPGYMLAQEFAESVYERHVDWTALLATETNFKGVLQERMQRELCKAPVYRCRPAGRYVQMSVWWNWGPVPDDDDRRCVVSLLEDVPSFDALRAMKAREPYVHMLLIDLPAMKGTIKEVEQHAAKLICAKLPPSHLPRAAGGVRIARPAAGAPAAAAMVVAAAPVQQQQPLPPPVEPAPPQPISKVVTPPPPAPLVSAPPAPIMPAAAKQKTTSSVENCGDNVDDDPFTASMKKYRAASSRKKAAATLVPMAPVPVHELYLGPATAATTPAAMMLASGKKRKAAAAATAVPARKHKKTA